MVSVNTQFDGASPENGGPRTDLGDRGCRFARAGHQGHFLDLAICAEPRHAAVFRYDRYRPGVHDIRDALGRVSNQLPEDADEPRIVKADADSQPIMRLALTSDTLSMEDLTLLAENEITDRLAAVEGVADVQINGDQEKIFRIDINQSKLASRGLTHRIDIVVDLESRQMLLDLRLPARGRSEVHGRDVERVAMHESGGIGLHDSDCGMRERQACTSCP